MTIAHRSRPIAVALVGVALLLAACSSSGGDTTTKATNPDGSGSGATTTTGATTSTLADGDARLGLVGQDKSKAAASKGCGSETATTGPVDLQKETIGDRYFLLTTPKGYDGSQPRPLVVDLHGLLEGAETHATDSQMGTYGSTHDFIVATPNGTGNPVHWEVANDTKGNQDLVFIQAMLDHLEAQQCIDTRRIYATGLSNGAFLSSTIGCTLGDRFAAIAPVSGLTFTDDCKPSRPIPVLTFHGTEDPILLFNGGVGDRLNAILSGSKEPPTPLPKANLDGKGYPAAVRAWAKADGCKSTFHDRVVTKTVTERTYDCPSGVAVIFEIVAGGGHTWPGSEFSKPLAKIMGATDTTIDANEFIWKFFQAFALPTT